VDGFCEHGNEHLSSLKAGLSEGTLLRGVGAVRVLRQRFAFFGGGGAEPH
jgi:hypothetical protein